MAFGMLSISSCTMGLLENQYPLQILGHLLPRKFIDSPLPHYGILLCSALLASPLLRKIVQFKSKLENFKQKGQSLCQLRKGFSHLFYNCYLQDVQLLFVPFAASYFFRVETINCLSQKLSPRSFHCRNFQNSSDELVFNFLKLKRKSCCEIENESFLEKDEKATRTSHQT